eukprot:2662441-Alexandrium_andersonii.AAC.1
MTSLLPRGCSSACAPLVPRRCSTDYLAEAVRRWRAGRKRLGPPLPVERLAADVRGLLRNDGASLLQ